MEDTQLIDIIESDRLHYRKHITSIIKMQVKLSDCHSSTIVHSIEKHDGSLHRQTSEIPQSITNSIF